MRNWLMKVAFNIIWFVAGRLGRDVARWVDDAEEQGLSGREAFDFVWKTAKVHYSDIDTWQLNQLIETVLGRKFEISGKLWKKLRWPRGI